MPPRTKLPENMLALTGDPMPPALPESSILRLASLTDASPEEFQKAMGALLRRLAVAGFREIRPPRNYKELATVVDLWRKLEGMDSKDKGGIPVGLVGVMRCVSRRPVLDAEIAPDPGDGDEGEPEFE